jgi:hypothetical protein
VRSNNFLLIKDNNFHAIAFTQFNCLVIVNLCAWNLSKAGNQRDVGKRYQEIMSPKYLDAGSIFSIMEPSLAMLLLRM